MATSTTEINTLTVDGQVYRFVDDIARTEIEDARTGADGTVFLTLGDAIRATSCTNPHKQILIVYKQTETEASGYTISFLDADGNTMDVNSASYVLDRVLIDPSYRCLVTDETFDSFTIPIIEQQFTGHKLIVHFKISETATEQKYFAFKLSQGMFAGYAVYTIAKTGSWWVD